jgi:UrcA family protein
MNARPSFAVLITLSAPSFAVARPASAEPASAAERGAALKVYFGDLNLSDPAGAQEWAQRFHHAATNVCDVAHRNLDFARRHSGCTGASVGDAVAELNSPQFTALNSEYARQPEA